MILTMQAMNIFFAALGALLLNLFLIGGLAAAFLRGVEPAHLPEFLPAEHALLPRWYTWHDNHKN